MFVRTFEFRVITERGDVRTDFQFHVPFWDRYCSLRIPDTRLPEFLVLASALITYSTVGVIMNNTRLYLIDPRSLCIRPSSSQIESNLVLHSRSLFSTALTTILAVDRDVALGSHTHVPHHSWKIPPLRFSLILVYLSQNQQSIPA